MRRETTFILCVGSAAIAVAQPFGAAYREPLKPGPYAGATYDLDPPSRDATKPIRSWNPTRLLVRGAHVEHWLSGVKVVDYELWTPDWERRVRESKFNDFPSFGRARRGHIGLQDHGDNVAFRNIKIRLSSEI